MPDSLFISDLHLCDDRPKTVELFLNFLSTTAVEADKLYILGDLFDAWVGDDDDSDTASAVIAGLNNLSVSGTAVYIMHGNRDFLIGDEFCQQSQASLLSDPALISIAAKKILLTHGDQLCTKDMIYQKARQMRLDPEWLGKFLQKDLSARKAIAADYRKQSGEAKSLLAADIMDVTDSEVVQWFEQYDADMMIHGHTHRPASHEHNIKGVMKKRIVLADWHEDEATAISISEQGELAQIRITA